MQRLCLHIIRPIPCRARFALSRGAGMRKPFIFKAGVLLGALLTSFPVEAGAQPVAPRILYSDLASGPNTGGQNNGGAFVSIYGNGFGASRGDSAITIGGGAAAAYPVWTDTRVTFQLGPAAQSGDITVTGNGKASNGIPFLVRPGNIYFIALNGDDGNSGGFETPWSSIQRAVDRIAPGDIVYAMDGVTQAVPGENGSLQLNAGGLPGNPMTLAAYPGATVTIGAAGDSQCATDSCYDGLRNIGTPSHWVFANLAFRGNNRAMNLQGNAVSGNGILTDFRFVGNDFSCPWSGSTPDACVTFGEMSYVNFFGNTVHDVATMNAANAIDESHGLYFSSDVRHVDAGWNGVYNIMACRGIQVHSSPLYGGVAGDPTGYNVFDILIHDNLIHDTRCDGIIMATLAPEQGPVRIYNNVIYSAGLGPEPLGGGGGYTCLYISGGTNNGPDSNGTVDIYNNTMFDCGRYARADGAAVSAAVALGDYSPNLKAQLRNNLIYQAPDELYTWDYNAPGASNLGGTNNMFYGSSTPPDAALTADIVANPLLANIGSHDFHLQSLSPAIRAGIPIPGLLTDRDGNPRPQSSANDVGAYQHASDAVSLELKSSRY